jgi:hypothetical protein
LVRPLQGRMIDAASHRMKFHAGMGGQLKLVAARRCFSTLVNLACSSNYLA